MSDETTREHREELVKSAKRIMEEVNTDEDVVNKPLPPNMYEKIMKRIDAYEAQCEAERLSAEEKELIYLGKRYKKKRRMRKYFVLAAAVIGMLAFGITSIGENGKIVEKFKISTMGREQTQINSSDSVEEEADWSEDEAYEEIESKYGFYPVKLDYLPDGIGFLEAEVNEEIPRIHMLYGEKQDVKISYIIRPDYRDGSWSKDIEDKLLEEYEMQIKDVTLHLQRYRVENDVERWIVEFEYGSTSYSLMMMNLEKSEVEKIVNNLYFY
ncbi:MAG: DUF4367 domain-containing protein [Tyzzerella sp.]|nr:DUF4367 domain-containing protein [Tyzzerella sp.]